jgi:2-polyprenyl-3-methyl-5-hydroxy-6-metoxy-1,4-benzoquinol methylase
MNTIFETLKLIGAASEKTKSIFSHRTRDREKLTVWKDSVSNVIYIDEFYVGDEEYETGNYRSVEESVNSIVVDSSYEDALDVERRLSDYRQYYAGNNICDVGCGDGLFILGAQKLASSVSGVELQTSSISLLKKNGINCQRSILNYPGTFDAIFMFHSLEHLQDPLKSLTEIRTKMVKDRSRLIVEVPHANDFLISVIKCRRFIELALWSQHLILHTRESLRRLLVAGGFNSVIIEGKQRYGIANHLSWLGSGQPGGHKSLLSSFETEQLKYAYEGSLQKIDATDTLVAIAEY